MVQSGCVLVVGCIKVSLDTESAAAALAASLGGEPGGHLIPLAAVHHLAQRIVVPPPLAGRLLYTGCEVGG